MMEGGNIVGCSAVGEHNTAGGVLVARSASFVMKAGKIAGCTAARGGGVYVGMAVLSVCGSAVVLGKKRK